MSGSGRDSCLFRVLKLYFNIRRISAAGAASGYQIKLDLSCSPLSIRMSWPVMLRLMLVIK